MAGRPGARAAVLRAFHWRNCIGRGNAGIHHWARRSHALDLLGVADLATLALRVAGLGGGLGGSGVDTGRPYELPEGAYREVRRMASEERAHATDRSVSCWHVQADTDGRSHSPSYSAWRQGFRPHPALRHSGHSAGPSYNGPYPCKHLTACVPPRYRRGDRFVPAEAGACSVEMQRREAAGAISRHEVHVGPRVWGLPSGSCSSRGSAQP